MRKEKRVAIEIIESWGTVMLQANISNLGSEEYCGDIQSAD